MLAPLPCGMWIKRTQTQDLTPPFTSLSLGWARSWTLRSRQVGQGKGQPTAAEKSGMHEEIREPEEGVEGPYKD